MADRTRRSIAQPKSYKVFNEKGHEAIPSATASSHSTLLKEGMEDEQCNSSSADSQEDTEVHIKSKKYRTLQRKQDGGCHVSSRTCDTDSETRYTTEEMDSSTSSDLLAEGDDQQVTLHLNPEEDDLDTDAIATPKKVAGKQQMAQSTIKKL